MIGIYKITNTLNGKSYIGQSKNIENRWRNHRWRYKYQEREHLFLYQAMRKYGIENFSFEVLEECSVEELDSLEIKYIAQYRSFPDGYNMTGGGNGHLGRPMTPEGKAALRKALVGRPCSEETRRRISEAQKGKIVPVEQRVKMGIASKRKWANPEYREKMCAIRRQRVTSEETRRKISEASKGRTHSEESRRKMSETKKGKVFTKEHREHLSDSHIGRSMPAEARENLSKALKGRQFSDEHRQRLSEAAKRREDERRRVQSASVDGKKPIGRAVLFDGKEYESVKSLSEEIGVPRNTLYRWLKGARIPDEYQTKGLAYKAS